MEVCSSKCHDFDIVVNMFLSNNDLAIMKFFRVNKDYSTQRILLIIFQNIDRDLKLENY